MNVAESIRMMCNRECIAVVVRRTVGTLTKACVCSCSALYPTFSRFLPDYFLLFPLVVPVPPNTGVKHTEVLGLPRNIAQNTQPETPRLGELEGELRALPR